MPESDASVSPLRRSTVALLLFGLNPFFLALMLSFAFLLAFAAPETETSSVVVLAILEIVLALAACAVFLFTAMVNDRELVTGFRWRRRRVALADIATVTVGKAERFGPRGSNAMGLRLGLTDGSHVMVRESRSCTRSRLLEWADTIQRHAPWIETHESPIAWETIRGGWKSPLDDSYRRSPRTHHGTIEGS